MGLARVAAIDIGTNSVLLLVAERGSSGWLPLVERATITRIGQGVDQAKVLDPEAVKRTLRVLEEYAGLAAQHGVDGTVAVGTSALRDARGSEAFLDASEALLGCRPRVITGAEEARLTFQGALSGLTVEGDVTVVDIGGGSTEVIVGEAGAEPRQAISLNVGSVRLHERHFASDPPRLDELAAARNTARRALAEAPGAAGCLVGVAGTVTTLAAIEQRLPSYDASLLHGSQLTADQVNALAERLAALPLLRRKRLAGLEPGRADVIVAGALLLAEVLRWAHVDRLVVSDRGVRWGLLSNWDGRPEG